MNFESDLQVIIQNKFKGYGIECNTEGMGMHELVSRFFEMQSRHISQAPRTVHLSNEIRGFLEKLRHMSVSEEEREVGGTIFELCRLLSRGGDVTRFLSKHVKNSPENQRIHDKLLWDYGMHHFHLSQDTDATGFVRRSDYLLFAIVTRDHAYFVDVRLHSAPKGLQWVHQDLLQIVYSNWPELFDSKVIGGVKGIVLTDDEKKELRGKNHNHLPMLGGRVFAPLGGGTAMDGSSMVCSFRAQRLLDEIRHYQKYFDTQPSGLRSKLESIGVDTTEGMQFELVLLDDLNLSNAVKARLNADNCFSKNLSSMGFAIVERTTHTLCT